MGCLRLILNDQLSSSITSLSDMLPDDVIVACEVMEEFTLVPHHPKKIAFLLASMRHFVADLADLGHTVYHVKLTDAGNSGRLTSEVKRAVTLLGLTHVVVTQPSEYRLESMIAAWPTVLGITLEVREDQRFFCSSALFNRWVLGKKQPRMEYFYREMRKKHRILLEDDGSPSGGQWNYDKENRKPPMKGLTSPRRLSHKKSSILIEVLQLVSEHFSENFGTLEPFHYAVTRQQALLELDDFIERILPDFGDYQDAMVHGDAYLNHSLLSTYLNAGLLLAREICQKAELRYRVGMAPLNAVEGFIRQILGWREYVRGIYWHHMPNYGELNDLGANTPLPAFYWGKPTTMACVAEVVAQTRQHAYSHHIQRLMVTGNFALLAGLDVKQVQAWYLAVYSDAFEWVEMPNTLGMALFGDGGIVGSKPYAASGRYIHKMSNFCNKCVYAPSELLGERACPFNALYWDFFARHREKLEFNPRLTFVYSTWNKFSVLKQEAIRAKAASILNQLVEDCL